jgi:hypothetical protein
VGAYPCVTLRIYFDVSFVGKFVYHYCHILEQEDKGMMGVVEVVPKGTLIDDGETAVDSADSSVHARAVGRIIISLSVILALGTAGLVSMYWTLYRKGRLHESQDQWIPLSC